MFQLLADGKISKEDYLKLTPKKSKLSYINFIIYLVLCFNFVFTFKLTFALFQAIQAKV